MPLLKVGARTEAVPPAPVYSGLSTNDYNITLDAWLPITHADYVEEYEPDIVDLGPAAATPSRADLSLNCVMRDASPIPVKQVRIQVSWVCSGGRVQREIRELGVASAGLLPRYWGPCPGLNPRLGRLGLGARRVPRISAKLPEKHPPSRYRLLAASGLVAVLQILVCLRFRV